MNQVVLVTGASSGFGRMIANELAAAGHIAYSSMRDLAGKKAHLIDEVNAYSREYGVDLRTIELDVQSEESAGAAVDKIVAEHGRLDVLVHNAGHMVFGPSEAFTPEQLADLYDINVLGCQRVNRAALPHMRRADVACSCGSAPAAWRGRAAVARPILRRPSRHGRVGGILRSRVAPLGIESSIVVPGAFTTGTNHFANAGGLCEPLATRLRRPREARARGHCAG